MILKKYRFMRTAGLSVCFAVLFGLCGEVQSATFVDYYSPRNAERPKRRGTSYIILHTTEGASKGSLKKLHDNGEAHYMVDTDGRIYRIISHDRVAFHSGRSMWAGITNIDDHSIGIEVVGYYERNITAVQYTALRSLLDSLKKIYKIPDERVLAHSMVAYGAPNRWHSRSHRGRKRCGMLFARDSVRAKLGLNRKPAFDPDVRAGRLVDADPALSAVLYGREKVVKQVSSTPVAAPQDSRPNVISRNRSAWDIARDKYNSADTTYIFPDGTRVAGNRVKDWKAVPSGTQVIMGGGCTSENPAEGIQELGRGGTASDIAGDEYNKRSTVYLLPDGSFKYGDQMAESDFRGIQDGTRVLVGYIYGGQVTAQKSAYDICGKRWNFPSTYYLLSDRSLKQGSEINERQIPQKAHVFYQQ